MLVLVAVLAVAGCGATAPEAGQVMSGLGSESTHVGVAYDTTGRGDKSFNDAAGAGLDRAERELVVGVSEVTAAANTDDARAASLRELVKDGSGLVVAVGFLYAAAIKTVAAEHPKVTFAIIDDASVTADNVVSLVFAEEQGSYLVGVAAALATAKNHIAFVGGVRVALIKKFEAGFVAGARSVRPGVAIDVAYLSDPPDFSGFSTPAKGRAAAAQLLARGADVVYAAAGGSGSGAFEAVAAVPKALAIGVDSDQYQTAGAAVRPRILTSMLKRVDNGVFQEIQGFVKGDRAGGVKRYDLKVDGVGYATSNTALIGPLQARLDQARYSILSGAVTVPAA
jgi:basic membrane protein A